MDARFIKVSPIIPLFFILTNTLPSPPPQILAFYARLLMFANGKLIKKKKTSLSIRLVWGEEETVSFDLPEEPATNQCISFMVVLSCKFQNSTSPSLPTSPESPESHPVDETPSQAPESAPNSRSNSTNNPQKDLNVGHFVLDKETWQSTILKHPRKQILKWYKLYWKHTPFPSPSSLWSITDSKTSHSLFALRMANIFSLPSLQPYSCDSRHNPENWNTFKNLNLSSHQQNANIIRAFRPPEPLCKPFALNTRSLSISQRTSLNLAQPVRSARFNSCSPQPVDRHANENVKMIITTNSYLVSHTQTLSRCLFYKNRLYYFISILWSKYIRQIYKIGEALLNPPK